LLPKTFPENFSFATKEGKKVILWTCNIKLSGL
jgi:hypothetical protein